MSEGDTTSNTYVTGDFIPHIQFESGVGGTITIRNDYEEKVPIYTKLADSDIYLLAKEDDTFTYLVNQKGELVMKRMEKK